MDKKPVLRLVDCSRVFPADLYWYWYRYQLHWGILKASNRIIGI